MAVPKKTKQIRKKTVQPAAVATKTSAVRRRIFKGTAHPVRLMPAWSIAAKAAGLIWRQRRLLAGITLIFGLLNIVLAQSLSGSDVVGLKNQLNGVIQGNFAGLTAGLVVFASLLGSNNSTGSDVAGAYRLFLVLIFSLAIIWLLRQTSAGATLRLRDAFYKGMYPLIPFILVVLVIGLQLIPLAIGSAVYSLVIGQGIAVLLIEKILWAVLFAGLALLSLYMATPSVMALYIVTLPNMTPLNALRSARELTKNRRFRVLRKILFMPLLFLIIAALIVVPVIILLPLLAKYVFFVLSTIALLGAHGYLYTLYRELLNE